MTTLAVVNDLIFASRIRAVAQSLGAAVSFVRSRDDLLARARGATLVLLDLETGWLDAVEDIAALKATAPAAVVIGFASHVRGELLQAARRAGADRVLARSSFVRELPELLRT